MHYPFIKSRFFVFRRRPSWGVKIRTNLIKQYEFELPDMDESFHYWYLCDLYKSPEMNFFTMFFSVGILGTEKFINYPTQKADKIEDAATFLTLPDVMFEKSEIDIFVSNFFKSWGELESKMKVWDDDVDTKFYKNCQDMNL